LIHCFSQVVTNLNVNETYVLYQCGTPKPSISLLSNVKFFSIPLTAVSVPDATSAAFLEALNLLGRIAYVTSYANNPCLQYLSSSTGCSLLSSAANAPDISNQSDSTAVFNYENDPTLPRSVAFTATADPGALNRAEWIKFMSLFFNGEATANSMFKAVSSNYNGISKVAKAISSSMAKPPIVAWVQWWPASPDYGPFGPNVPALSVNFPQYKKQLTADAGAVILGLSDVQSYIDAGVAFQPNYWGTDSIYMRMNATDAFRAMLKNVDVVIDEARYISGSGVGLSDPSITTSAFIQAYGLTPLDAQTLKFLLSGQGLLREDGLTSPDSWTSWFGNAVVRPDQVLADLVQSLYPSTSNTGKFLTAVSLSTQPVQFSSGYFLRNVGQGQVPKVLTAATCPTQIGCSLPVSPICPYVYMSCNGTLVYATSASRCAPTCASVTAVKGSGMDASAVRPVVLLTSLLALIASVYCLCF
jgi:hypothetical protein